MIAVTDRPLLRDDDGVHVARGMPSICALSVSPDHAELLGELASAVALDQAYVDGLNRAVPTSPLDTARILACKLDCRMCAKGALPPLTKHAGGSAVGYARLQARYVLSLELQRLESPIDEYLSRG